VLNLKEVHGIVLRDNEMFLATTKKLLRAKLSADGKLDEPKEFADLPDGGQHPRRTLGFDGAGLLYVSVGSTCNACEETNPEHAAMLRMRPDGSERRVFAKGLRNTIGFAWHPQTGELWGMDHGSDNRGNDVPPEELNLIKDGADYGWPFCHSSNQVDQIANKPKQGTKEERCAKATPPALFYQAHAAPIAFVFYTGSQFPAEFRGDAFVAFHGSWNRAPAAGYSVARVKFENGKPKRFEDFVSGFLIENGKAQFGRPAGLVVAKDGSLLISDDTGGVVYRVSHGR
jgi:glucose/arabinose dehydrogenase